MPLSKTSSFPKPNFTCFDPVATYPTHLSGTKRSSSTFDQASTSNSAENSQEERAQLIASGILALSRKVPDMITPSWMINKSHPTQIQFLRNTVLDLLNINNPVLKLDALWLAIATCRQALSIPALDPLSAAELQYLLGHAYTQRNLAGQNGCASDFDLAIATYTSALELPFDNHELRASITKRLSMILIQRNKPAQDLRVSDLTLAILACKKVLTSSKFDLHTTVALQHIRGLAYAKRNEPAQNNLDSDLDLAIKIYILTLSMIDATTDNNRDGVIPTITVLTRELVTLLIKRNNPAQNELLSDLTLAIFSCEQTLVFISLNSHILAQFLDLYISALIKRNEPAQNERLSDLDLAHQACLRAFALPCNSKCKDTLMRTLLHVTYLENQWMLNLQNLDELDSQIYTCNEVLRLSSISLELRGRLCNHLVHLFYKRNRENDLENAINTCKDALELQFDDASVKAELKQRFEAFKQIKNAQSKILR